jgi:hypothetical protein
MNLLKYGPRVGSLGAFGLAVLIGACNSHVTSVHSGAPCLEGCAERLPHCSELECKHGCAIALDLSAQGEAPTLLDCMKNHATCTVPDWAQCTARTGPNKNGGPPAPAPVKDPDDLD